MSRRKHYIRLGDIPKGRSQIAEEYRQMVRARTGALPPKFEDGVSVYPTIWSPFLNRWVIFEDHGTVLGLAELWYQATRGKRSILLVVGRVNGEGEDGEPVLRPSSINIVKTLSPSDVYIQAEGIDQLDTKDLAMLLPEAERQIFLKATIVEKKAFKQIKQDKASPNTIAAYNEATEYLLKIYQALRNQILDELSSLN